MQFRILILGAAALFGQWLPLGAHAESAPPVLTLEQAIQQALASNPALRAAAQNIAIADGARVQAGLWRNPELSLLREGTQRNNRTQTVQLSQPLEVGGKRAARIALADTERSLAAGEVQVGAAGLRADVTAAYFDALTAQERVGLAQGSLDLAQKASNAANRRVAAGKISPVEETRSKVAAASARLEMLQASAELVGARRRLAALWGSTAPLEQPLLQPEAGLHALPRLELLQARLDAAPQLQRARQQIRREEAQVALERAERVPDVALTLGNKKDHELGRSQTVVGLSIPLPLFDRNQGRLLSALRRLEQARAQLEADQLQLGQALADAYQRAEVAQAQIEAMRAEMLPAAQSALSAAVTGFELGKFNFLDVLDAQRTLFQARAQYLAALSDRYRSMAELQRYVAFDDIGRAPTTDRNIP